MALTYKLRIAQKILKNHAQKYNVDLNSAVSNIRESRLRFDGVKNYVSFNYFFDPNEPLDQKDMIFDTEIVQNVQFLDNKISFSVDIEKYLRSCVNDDLSFSVSRSLKKTSKTVVDFSSPNIAKPFHFGHLRSTIIGNFVSNILTHMGDDVVRINYLGDWGVQFGLLKYGLNECKVSVNELNENPLRVLYNAYVTANRIAESQPQVNEQAKEIFRKMEFAEIESDDLKDWSSIRTQTVNEISKVYARLGIYFDEYSWESDYSAKRIENLIKTLIDKNIIIKEDDAWMAQIDSSEPVPVIKRDGTTLYITRDLAAVLDRYERHKFDKMLYVVDHTQSKHFKNLTCLVEKLDSECAKKIEHVSFGRVIGLSSRKGTAIFLDDILNEILEKMKEERYNSLTTRGGYDGEISDILGISNVVINDMRKKRSSGYNFNWDSILQLKGDCGVGLQYNHCKLYSLEENCGIELPKECDLSILKEYVAVRLLFEISRFEDVILKSYNDLDASILINYLFDLCNAMNKAYGVLKVKGESDLVASQRLLMFHKVRLILNIGMKIIGLKPLNQM